MSPHDHRILAVIDPVPSVENQVRQFVDIIRQHQPQNVLWVTLCDDISISFTGCHVPFLPPAEWMKQTEADLLVPFTQIACQNGYPPIRV